MRPVLLCLALTLTGCEEPSPGTDADPPAPADTDATPTNGDTTQPPGSPWADPDTERRVGPLDHLELFRSGCGDQLWLRFVPSEDFGLLEFRASLPEGGNQTQTWFEVPVFLEGEPSYHLALDNGGYTEGSYDLEIRVRTGDDATNTHTITLPARGLAREPGLIGIDQVRQNASGEFDATITPQITGDLRQIFLYEASTECRVASFQRFSGEPLRAGTTTETSFGSPALTSGEDYFVVLRGNDTAREYIYYATDTFTAP